MVPVGCFVVTSLLMQVLQYNLCVLSVVSMVGLFGRVQVVDLVGVVLSWCIRCRWFSGYRVSSESRLY